ncbi:MAG TPA: DUF5666 domain-containing protein [Terriglobia bacterium]|nr:DUF5666 domain-containing protein [Terriglobia bacterium]
MVMRRVAVLTGLLLCTLQLPRTTFASTPLAVPAPSAQDMFTVEGKITEKTAGKLTISSGENIIFHVLYNDKTEIRKKDGSVGAAQDLHTGLRVSIAGDLAENGEITAKKIEIEGEGSDKQ